MGGVVSLIVDLVALTIDLSTYTGFTVEAIIAGEAAAAVEAQVASILAFDASIQPLEALASLGFTAEQFSYMSAIPTFVNDAIGLGVVLQTVSGAGQLVQAGIAYSRTDVSVVNRNLNMNVTDLVIWRPEDYYDILFPGLSRLSWGIDILNNWGRGLFRSVGRYIWSLILQETRLQLEAEGRRFRAYAQATVSHTIANILENARWVVTSGPVSAYQALEDYYRALPPLNPPQRRQLYERLRIQFEEQGITPHHEESGEIIDQFAAPGGAHQRVTPDWMLPLILGLYGDITPVWGEYLREFDVDGPPKKKRRV